MPLNKQCLHQVKPASKREDHRSWRVQLQIHTDWFIPSYRIVLLSPMCIMGAQRRGIPTGTRTSPLHPLQLPCRLVYLCKLMLYQIAPPLQIMRRADTNRQSGTQSQSLPLNKRRPRGMALFLLEEQQMLKESETWKEDSLPLIHFWFLSFPLLLKEIFTGAYKDFITHTELPRSILQCSCPFSKTPMPMCTELLSHLCFLYHPTCRCQAPSQRIAYPNAKEDLPPGFQASSLKVRLDFALLNTNSHNDP